MKAYKIRANWKKNKWGMPSKSPICQLPSIVDCKTWYQIQVETLHFDQNG